MLAEPEVKRRRRDVVPASLVRDLEEVRRPEHAALEGIERGFDKAFGSDVAGEECVVVVEAGNLHDRGLIRRDVGGVGFSCKVSWPQYSKPTSRAFFASRACGAYESGALYASGPLSRPGMSEM